VTYHNGTNNVRLAGSTSATKKFLTQTGNGSVSAAPAWGQPADTDITFTDVTTNNASASAHGFLTKLSGSTSDVLRGDGAFSNIGVPVYARVTGSDFTTSSTYAR
jgi:hypothetical protein